MFSGRTVEPHFRQNNSSFFNFFSRSRNVLWLLKVFSFQTVNFMAYSFIYLIVFLNFFFCIIVLHFTYIFAFPFFIQLHFFFLLLLLLYANPSLKKNPLFYLDIKLTIKNIDIVRVGNSFKHMNTAVIWGPLLMRSQRRRILDCISILGKG